MKKILLVILSVFYLAVSSGITLNYHYCMGKLAGVELGGMDKCASCGQMKKSSHCCSTETQFVKLELDQDVSHASLKDLAPATIELLAVLFSELLVPDAVSAVLTHTDYDIPFKSSGVPIFIHHCTFLI